MASAAGAADLFVDAPRAPGLVAQLIDHPEQLRRFVRVHVTAFSNGTLLGPTGCGPFARGSRPQDDVVTLLTKACRAADVRVCWYLDLLRWRRAGLPAPTLGEDLAEVWERNLAGQFGSKNEPDLYASPWHPRTRLILARLMTAMADWEPQPDGLTVTCRLSFGELLGYSVKARRETILALGVDPVDPMDRPTLVKWYHQREDTMTALVGDLAGIYHARRPDMPFHGLCSGDYLNSSPGIRLYRADGGFRWAQSGLVDSLLLDGPWWKGVLQAGAFRDHLNWLQQEAKADPKRAYGDRLFATVQTRDNTGQLRLAEQLDALARQGCGLDRICFYPTSDGDLPLILAALDDPPAPVAKP